MAKYKVGDRVVIKDDLVIERGYGDAYWIRSMDKFKGKVVTINDVDGNGYHIEEMGRFWTEEMIKGLAKDKKESVGMINVIEVDMELVLKDELDAGLKVFAKGTRAKVVKVIEGKGMAHIKIQGDLGVFKFDEIKEYFEEYVKPKVEIKAYDPELGEDDIKRIFQNGNAVIVFLNSGAKGVAKCHDDDEFDFEVGKRVAYLKAKIKELQNELKTY